ncbi:alpha/beta hydrolase [Sphingomonas sp. CL5.1]|uniref:alpha/beta fold hydrolase n=1 Tax=Sphingomonas sp. CL5.1 TaxID=2653203 RepID=UPI00158188E2|nr:alpha/beta hydrolase [Sphingomonas sp. CL5.1]QKR99913.1 alpha/beta hydrolase [Sphingomonas sp. CL5.1]
MLGIAALAPLAAAGGATGQVASALDYAIYAAAPTKVDIGGRRIALRCAGTGGPTVVLDTGLGGWSIHWWLVQPVLAKRVRTCACDRAGFGDSDPPPGPQTVGDVARDLHAALRAAREKPPYVLVGQSLGGVEVRLFTQRWRHEVAGMVLVDSSFADQVTVKRALPGWDAAADRKKRDDNLDCARRAAAPSFKPGNDAYARCAFPPPDGAPAVIAATWPHYFTPSYFTSSQPLSDSLSGTRFLRADKLKLGVMPLVVLTGLNRPAPARGQEQYMKRWLAIWQERHEALARMSSRGVHRIVADSGHNIQFDQPQAVLAAIDQVLDQLGAEAR